MYIIRLNAKNKSKYRKHLSPMSYQTISLPSAYALAAVTSTGEFRGALIANTDRRVGYLHSLCFANGNINKFIGTKLLRYWSHYAHRQGLDYIKALVVAPKDKMPLWQNIFQEIGFSNILRLGEIITINPHEGIKSKFIQKAYKRGLHLPSDWICVPYSQLTALQKQELAEQGQKLLGKLFSYDTDWDYLELNHSYAFFKGSEVMGYISQRRLTTNIASVPMLAANPNYPGAGLTILRYYFFSIHFQTPEIYRLKVHFTAHTEVSKRLFLYYADCTPVSHTLDWQFLKKLRS